MSEMEDIKESLKKMPSFITENEDGTYSVEVKKEEKIPEGIVIFEEKSGAVIKSCEKMAANTNEEMEVLLARRSIKEPVLSDDDFGNLKGSNYMKLKFATLYIYGLNDFL